MARTEKQISKRKNIWIDAKLHHVCHMEAVKLNVSVQEYVDELIRSGLKKEGKK